MDIATGPVLVTTPVDVGALRLRRLSAHDAMSELFRYEIDLVGTADVPATCLLGQPMTVHLRLGAGAAERCLRGIVAEFELIDEGDQESQYQAVLRPWLWLLTLNADCRIFQRLTIPEIVKRVLRDRGFCDFEERLSESYPCLDFVVQYRESDFEFIDRLLRRAGIYFYFDHRTDASYLILADSRAAHEAFPDYEVMEFCPPDAHRAALGENVHAWSIVRTIGAGAFASRDFDFERPRVPLSTRIVDREEHGPSHLEVYEYPGGSADAYEAQARARVRLEQLKAPNEVASAETNAKGLVVGRLFKMVGHPREDPDREYLICSADFEIRGLESRSQAIAFEDLRYQCRLKVLPSEFPYRPPFARGKVPSIGPQTAIVVGKAGEEIWTDRYGRVKVQFHWDRSEYADERSSCWIRVAQIWTGAGWGSLHVPRVGQEVVVDFLDGDPDRPIITGCVYNGDNSPPYELPGQRTQSGIRSSSTKGGAASAFNEMRFEDQKGAELVAIQAQKDMRVLVKDSQSVEVGTGRTTIIGLHDDTLVGGNRSLAVTGMRTSTIGVNDITLVAGGETRVVGMLRSVTVNGGEVKSVSGAQSIVVSGERSVSAGHETIGVGSRSVAVAQAQSTTIGTVRTLTVGGDNTVGIAGSDTRSVQMNGQLQIGRRLTVAAGEEIVLETGAASLTLRANGDVVIRGQKVLIDGTHLRLIGADGVKVKGSTIDNN